MGHTNRSVSGLQVGALGAIELSSRPEAMGYVPSVRLHFPAKKGLFATPVDYLI
jgi:hypothetical protein